MNSENPNSPFNNSVSALNTVIKLETDIIKLEKSNNDLPTRKDRRGKGSGNKFLRYFNNDDSQHKFIFLKNKTVKYGSSKKYRRQAVKLTKNHYKELKSRLKRKKLKKDSNFLEKCAKNLADSEILLPYTAGYIKSDTDSKKHSISQSEIIEHADLGTRKKIFDLQLSLGKYVMDFERNGRHVCLGGKSGSLSLFDLHTNQILTEINVHETVRDVKILQNHTLFSAAQKKYVYIYDNNGVEIHCLRNHSMTRKLEYLPYHFLLVSIGDFGVLRYQDISTGEVIGSYKTKKGFCATMRQNKRNASIFLGHTDGSVSIWVPNSPKPIVQMLCHKGSISALDIYKDYLITSGVDGFWRIFDLRKSSPLNSIRYFGTPPTSLDISQTGFVSIGFSSHVQVWDKDLFHVDKSVSLMGKKSIISPLITSEYPGEEVGCVRFIPYEDILGIGRTYGFSTILCPGSAEPNFDSFYDNPYQTPKQRQEIEIRHLLDKLKPDMISINTDIIGNIDKAPKHVIIAERQQEKKELEEDRMKNKKVKNKKRGKNKSENLNRKKQIKAKDEGRNTTKRRLEDKRGKTGRNPVSEEVFDPLDRFRNEEKARYT